MLLKKSKSFFDTYPHEYEILTDEASRQPKHREEVRALVTRFQPTRVLDAGCAAGLTAGLFAEGGIAAVGLDRSRGMLKVARRKYQPANDRLRFMYGEFEKLPAKLSSRFDLVVCLANSITGVSSVSGLERALRNFKRVLLPGGTLVVQMLNYAAIMEGETRPVKGTASNGIVYERFTERQDNRLYLYVTRLDLNVQPPRLEIFKHQSDNFSVAEMTRALKTAGFVKIEKYADLLFSRAFHRHARDLIIIGRKPKP